MKTVGVIIIRFFFSFLLLEMFNMSCALWISKSVKNTAGYFPNVFEHGLLIKLANKYPHNSGKSSINQL